MMESNVLIIAKAGVNHNGNINIAKKIIDVAAGYGVNAVKFQTFNSKKLVNKFAKQAEYQKKNIGNESSQYDMIKKLELNHEMHLELISYCKEKDIMFFSTTFDFDSIDMLYNLGLKI